MSRIILLLALVFMASGLDADTVLWEHYLSNLPPGWSNDGFYFNEYGAYSHIYVWGWYPADGASRAVTHTLETGTSECRSDYDSLVIDLNQSTFINNQGGNAIVKLQMDLNGDISTLWQRNLPAAGNGCREMLSDHNPIHEVITGISEGDQVRFIFYSHAGVVYGEVTIHWHLWNASLTAYGDLPLQQSTWAGIKLLLSDR